MNWALMCGQRGRQQVRELGNSAAARRTHAVLVHGTAAPVPTLGRAEMPAEI